MQGDQMEQLLEMTYEARDGYLKQMGSVDSMVLAPLVNPGLVGGPRWPSLREAWRTVRNGNRTLIVSDGLSDPFDDEPEANVGFGIEILGETADPLPEQLQTSWLFSVVYEVSQQAAAHGGFRALIDRLGILSMEINAPNELKHLAGPEGNIGLLLGLRDPALQIEWQIPAGRVKVVTAKVLCPEELVFVTTSYEEARKQLTELFAGDGSYHRSSISRRPVV